MANWGSYLNRFNLQAQLSTIANTWNISVSGLRAFLKLSESAEEAIVVASHAPSPSETYLHECIHALGVQNHDYSLDLSEIVTVFLILMFIPLNGIRLLQSHRFRLWAYEEK